LIDPDCFRETNLPADLFEYLHNIRAAEVEARFDRGSEAGSLSYHIGQRLRLFHGVIADGRELSVRSPCVLG
jgi:hypothetical protein